MNYPIRDDLAGCLPLQERAEKSKLPDELYINEIGELLLKDEHERCNLYKDIIEACKAGTLKYSGDIEDWPVHELFKITKEDEQAYPHLYREQIVCNKINALIDDLPLVEEGKKYGIELIHPPKCKIHRDDFKVFLQSKNLWPVENCLLANWWQENQIQQHNEDGWVALPEPGFFGESIAEAESLPFYQAYQMLENRLANLSYVEFGLFVYDDDIRIFETRPDEKGYLARLPGVGKLNQVGIAEAFSQESTPLESTLSRFLYAKADIERLTPQFRYVPFENACTEIAAFAGKEETEIRQFLIDLANREHICPHHPYCGFAHPENKHLWPQSAYPGDEIDNILRDEFGIDEKVIDWDIAVYLG